MISSGTAQSEIASVGVVGISPGCTTDLKRELLLFDRLATVLRTATMDHPKLGRKTFVRDQAEEDAFRQRMRDVDFLGRHGIAFGVDDVSVPDALGDDPLVRQLQDEFLAVSADMFKEMPIGGIRTYAQMGEAMATRIPQMTASDCRLTAMKLRRLSGMDAYPVIPPEAFVDIDKPATGADVIQISWARFRYRLRRRLSSSC